jgi:hypothetical protein
MGRLERILNRGTVGIAYIFDMIILAAVWGVY